MLLFLQNRKLYVCVRGACRNKKDNATVNGGLVSLTPLTPLRP